MLAPGGLFVLTDALADGWLWRILVVSGGGRLLRPGELDAMLVTEHLRFVARSSVPRVRAIKVTLARATG